MIKICLLIEELDGGGAERSAGLLSIILSNLNYEVVILTLYDNITYPYKARLINLGKHIRGANTVINKFNRYRKLQNEIKENKFDLILDFRMKTVSLREFLLNTMVFNTKVINMVRSFNLSWYLPNPKTFSFYLYKNYAGINTVSYKIQKKIGDYYGFSNINTIYNPIDIDFINSKFNLEKSILDEYVVAVGRLDANKQFDKLIEAYNVSILPERDIKLYIIGNGAERDFLVRKIDTLNLKGKVIIFPFQENPFVYFKQAKFLILSSKNEGFPRVLIESLACMTPVVSFDCNSGPSEIVSHRQNGLLVENQNFKELKVKPCCR